MTKADLIDEVSKVTELSRKDSEVIVETLFDSIIKALKTGDKLEVRGFGSFRIRERKPDKAEILRPEKKSAFLKRKYPTSSPARS